MREEASFHHLVQRLEPFIFLYITEKCQLRCKHCYMGDRLERERFMPATLVEEILRAMRILYGHYKVYILGGEPTLHPQLETILKICKREKYLVVLSSNGLLPEKRWEILSTDYIDSFSFSLDGAMKEVHELLRGKNTYAPLIKSIKRAVELGFQTRLIYTVTKHNVHDVENALSLAEELGVNMISFHYFTPTGLGQNYPELQIHPHEWTDFCAWLRAKKVKDTLHVYFPPAFVRDNELSSFVNLGYRGCTARNLERLAFFPDRRCYICSAFLDIDVHYGEFWHGQIVPRQNADGLSELKLMNRPTDNCAKCYNSSLCRGGCAVYNYFHRTITSDDCDRKIVPLCPLWSVSTKPMLSPEKIHELR